MHPKDCGIEISVIAKGKDIIARRFSVAKGTSLKEAESNRLGDRSFRAAVADAGLLNDDLDTTTHGVDLVGVDDPESWTVFEWGATPSAKRIEAEQWMAAEALSRIVASD